MRTMGFKQIQLTRRRIMTDPYGTIMVCGDYEGNAEAIANALNLLGLNLDGVEFCANEERVALEDYHVRSPTVFPEQDVIRFDDDRRVHVLVEPLVLRRQVLVRPVQRIGIINSHAILGGLHHHYVRV
jgi:hypothetical protein